MAQNGFWNPSNPGFPAKDTEGTVMMMLKKDVEIGKIYAVKVSDIVVAVRILTESPYGGWNGKNLKTGRDVRIKTAGRIRHEITNPNNPMNVIYGL
ncbi:MAG: hypothetical protein PHN89_03935 [Candidatus Pacebacteria bacterium]|nr:hypothetical protein [Candidatus Paceibacterota bacterium]